MMSVRGCIRAVILNIVDFDGNNVVVELKCKYYTLQNLGNLALRLYCVWRILINAI